MVYTNGQKVDDGGWEKDEQNGNKINKNVLQINNVVKEHLYKSMISHALRFCIWSFICFNEN